MVGRDGISALPFIAGATAAYTTLVSVSGEALRLRVDAVRAECERSVALHRALMQRWHGMMNEIATRSACHRFHTARQRLAAVAPHGV